MTIYLALFALLWIFRYTRLIVNCISHWTFRPKPIPSNPRYNADDVTIIIPTLDGDTPSLRDMIDTLLATDPHEIILVTIDGNFKKAAALRQDKSIKKIRVLSSDRANKRVQLCKAIPEVTTSITILADDDVLWPHTVLPWILAPFEDEDMGGVGTCQRLVRAKNPSFQQRIWNFLGAIYLERRNFDISACTHMDGGLPCLSGRTVAYRTDILNEPGFLHEFQHETWGTCLLYADDDNFITRWMVNRGYKTYVQYHKAAEVRTTLEDNADFLKQCLRWSRSNWRSNLTSMFVDRNVWWQQPWSSYAVHQTTLTAWAIPTDIAIVWLAYQVTEGWPDQAQYLATLGLWMFFTKSIKLIGHFIRYPVDTPFVLLSILFGYFHGVLKLYAAFTLGVTTWGSRGNADTDNDYRMQPRPPYTRYDERSKK